MAPSSQLASTQHLRLREGFSHNKRGKKYDHWVLSASAELAELWLELRAPERAAPNTMGEIQNLVLLALCWACTLSSSTLLTSIGPLTAEQVGAPESLAPLAVACFLFGAAITYAKKRSNPGLSGLLSGLLLTRWGLALHRSVPSAWIFRRCGRRGGFLLGSALIVASGGAGAAGLWLGELWLIYGATLLAGLGQGFGQFYRFAAMEVCPPARKPFAVTLVLSGGVLA